MVRVRINAAKHNSQRGFELLLPLGRAGHYLDVLAVERVVLILVEGDTSIASKLLEHCTPDLKGLEASWSSRSPPVMEPLKAHA